MAGYVTGGVGFIVVCLESIEVMDAFFAAGFEKTFAFPENRILVTKTDKLIITSLGKFRKQLLSIAAGVYSAGVNVVAYDTYHIGWYFVLFQGFY